MPRIRNNAFFNSDLFGRRMDMARCLMDYHGLFKWELVSDRGCTRAGACYGPPIRRISLSRYLVGNPKITDEQVNSIILHEIAHALVGTAHGHDDVWREMAIRIGSDGNEFHNLMLKCPKVFAICLCHGGRPKPVYRVTKQLSNEPCKKCFCKRHLHSL